MMEWLHFGATRAGNGEFFSNAVSNRGFITSNRFQPALRHERFGHRTKVKGKGDARQDAIKPTTAVAAMAQG